MELCHMELYSFPSQLQDPFAKKSEHSPMQITTFYTGAQAMPG